MKYEIEFSGFLCGTVEIFANSKEEAMDMFHDMSDEEILKEANADVGSSMQIDSITADDGPIDTEENYVFD